MANLVTFAKKLWKDATSGGTPITAAELNRMEGGISNCATQINKLGDSVSPKLYLKIKDLNDVVKPGVYLLEGNAEEAANVPVAREYSGLLIVFGARDDRCIQIHSVSNGRGVYIRMFWGVWYEWHKLA